MTGVAKIDLTIKGLPETIKNKAILAVEKVVNQFYDDYINNEVIRLSKEAKKEYTELNSALYDEGDGL